MPDRLKVRLNKWCLDAHWLVKEAATFFAIMILFPCVAFSLPSGITYQGRILKPDGTPLSGANVQFKMQIRSPDTNNCLMYEEMQALDMRNSNGVFAITIDDGSGTRTDTSGYQLDKILSNEQGLANAFSFNPSVCSNGNSYSPNTGDGRSFVVYFKDETMASFEPMPAQRINFVPFAFEAKQVAGFTINNLVRVAEADGTLDNISPLNNVQYAALTALVNGTSNLYLQSGASGIVIPNVASPPGSPSSGQIWYNTTTNTLQYFNGGSTQTAVAGPWKMTLPAGTGSSGQVLQTNGAGVMSWITPLTSSSGFANGGNSFGADASIGTNDNYRLDVKTNNAIRMTVDAVGNVGIGTTSPAQLVDVKGNVGSGVVAVEAQNTAATGVTKFKLDNDTLGHGIEVGALGSGYSPMGAYQPESAYIAGLSNNGLNLINVNANSPIRVFTGGTLSTNERMRIDQNGNIGIGTTAPSGIFDVEGGTAPAGRNGSQIALTAQNAGAGNQSGGDVDLLAGNSTGTGSAGNININPGTQAGASSTGGSVSISSGQIIQQTSGNYTSVYITPNISTPASSTSTASYTGLNSALGFNTVLSSSPLASVNAGVFDAGNWGANTTLGSTYGVIGKTRNNGSSSVTTTSAGVWGHADTWSTATTTNASGGYFDVGQTSGGTNTNAYGVNIGTIKGTKKWSMYASDATAPSYFAGNVGIGTTAPTSPLTLNAVDSSANAQISVTNASNATIAQGAIQLQNDASNKATLGINSSSSIQAFGPNNTFLSASAAGSTLALAGNGSVSIWTNMSEKFRVTPIGNVGIGTTSPSAVLDVQQIKLGSAAVIAENAGTSFWMVMNPTGGATNSWNVANSIEYVGKDTGTGRSINAAGTINASGADFAEWVDWPTDPKPEMGSIVLFKGSYVVVSSPFKAAFIGNDVKDASRGILIAFAGQLPVVIRGPVHTGDLIVANGDGTGRAISKTDATFEMAQNAVGTAWESSTESGVHRVNVAIGVGLGGGGARDLANLEAKTKKMETENAALKSWICSKDPMAPFCK